MKMRLTQIHHIQMDLKVDAMVFLLGAILFVAIWTRRGFLHPRKSGAKRACITHLFSCGEFRTARRRLTHPAARVPVCVGFYLAHSPQTGNTSHSESDTYPKSAAVVM